MDPFFTGTSYQECCEWVSNLYSDVEFKGKIGFMTAQVDAIMAARLESRDYPEFLPGSTTRVYLRDARDYAYDIERGVIFNVHTKQILQASKRNNVNIKRRTVYVHNIGLKACVPEPDYHNISADHINLDHTDHRLCNLRWASSFLQNTNQHKPESINTPAIQSLEDKCWVTYVSRRDFLEKLGLEYTPTTSADLSIAINGGTRFKGHYVRNGIPDDVGELRDIPSNVIGVTGFKASEFGGYIRRPNGRFCQGSYVRRSGYYSIKIDGSSYLVHVLTTFAFHGLKPSKDAQSNHKKGVNGPADAADLEWLSPSENSQHAHDTGLNPSARAVMATLKDGTTQSFHSMTEAVRHFKEKNIMVSKNGIFQTCKGTLKSHCGIRWVYADGGVSKKRKFIDDDE